MHLLLRQPRAAAGIDNTLLGSDLGQRNKPHPVEADATLERGLLDARLPAGDARKLVNANPAYLLRL